MDSRTLLAVALILMVLLLPTFFIESPAPRVVPTTVDSSVTGDPLGVEAAVDTTTTGLGPAAADSGNGVTAPTPAPTSPSGVARSRPVVVSSPLYRFTFSTSGGRLVGAELLDFRAFTGADDDHVQLMPDQSEFLAYSLVVGVDTVSLADWAFEPSDTAVSVPSGGADLVFEARRGVATVRITYHFRPDTYQFDVRGEVLGLPRENPLVLVGLGPRLRSTEVDTTADLRTYGVVTKARSTDNLKFGALDPGEPRDLPGPFEWVAVKSKYFLAAVLAIEGGTPQFGGARAVGGDRGPRVGRFRGSPATEVHVTASLPAPGGIFSHSVYVGPQEYRRLARIGHDLEDANPYGWIFRPIIRPLSIVVVRLMLWLHESFSIGYGVVLILFGIAIRLALWPLNQRAMRSQMAMQAIQPEITEVRDRYKNDPRKMQEEMMKLYRRHGMGPLGPLGGCLPIFLQMPVLFTLFFVFLNTIEFRGVPFLWLPDLSRPDPLFIIPLLMGASMFALSKIGQIGVPPNPQAKVMLYVMPVVFTLLFLQFSSGLNLYYATSNMASLPQQWLVAQERLRRKKGKPPS